MSQTPPAHFLDSARERAGLDPRQLWWAYAILGGTASEDTVEGFLDGRSVLDPDQYDILAQAVNDRLVELGIDHRAPYAGKGPDGEPD